MEILVARNAGFCFGVQKAIERAEEVGKNRQNAYTYGPIIHNNQVVENLKSKGVGVVNDINELARDSSVIIRSHGISKAEYNRLEDIGVEIVDATCPYVMHIHKVVEEKYNAGYKIVIVGDPNHPEVRGINGWCSNQAVIVNSEEDIYNISDNSSRICIVSQTTYNQEKWYIYLGYIVKKAREVLIFNTICNATQLRQDETLQLSKLVDAMIVIGGRESSNTKKLFEICKSHCSNTIFAETEEEINLEDLKGVKKLGITAGASTPNYIIQNVINKIKSMDTINTIDKDYIIKQNEKAEGGKMEKNFTQEEQEYFASFKKIYPGDIVDGKVISVTNQEVFVDLGYKSDGILPIEEVSGVDVNLKERFKPGDEIKVSVVAMNDGEGNVVLSRKEVEKEEFQKEILAFKEQGKVIEVNIKELNKGGYACQFGNLKAFMPLSLSGVAMGEDGSGLVGKRVKVKIAEVKEKRDDIEIIVSRKEIVREERELKKKELFEKLEAGQVYKGIVKSTIKVGAFISIGEADVFVPISEISWKRIGAPSDVLKENDKVEVLIIKVNKDELKVTGSIKQLTKEPWEEFISRYKVDDVVEVKVARFAEFGVFVEIISGVDGLIHISNLSQNRVNKAQDVVKAGQIVKAKIIKVDMDTKKVSLSLKDVE